MHDDQITNLIESQLAIARALRNLGSNKGGSDLGAIEAHGLVLRDDVVPQIHDGLLCIANALHEVAEAIRQTSKTAE